MSQAPRHVRSRGWGAAGVVVVLLLATYLFAANARLSGGLNAREPQDLAQLVRTELEASETVALEVATLQAEVDRFADALAETSAPAQAADADLLAFTAGRVPAVGPGLTVRLDDASPNAPRPSWATNDDLVVHQQDLQAVMNALWAGGAEVMTLQDQRVITTSAFRCVGNVLLLHGRQYSPPYIVRAIGDTEAMLEALEDSEAVQVYLEYVEALGLGWSVQEESRIEAPAYDASSPLRFASVPDGVDVLGAGTP